MKPNKLLIVRCFKLGVPLSLQSSMIAISCMALQGVVNTYGEDVIAANTITSRVEMIVQMGFSLRKGSGNPLLLQSYLVLY